MFSVNKKILTVFFLYIIILSSCAGRNKSVYIPVPGNDYFTQNKKIIELDSIIETQNGQSNKNLPVWLSAYISGGIEEIERIDAYYDKYAFIAFHEGVNFNAMKMWADKFSPIQDFSMIAADRIQRRMISLSTLYPDYEYGIFYEIMIKNAYSAVYDGVVKEDTFWIKVKVDNVNEGVETERRGAVSASEAYIFFVLLTVDRMAMQNTVANIMTDAYSKIGETTGSQRSAINRLRQTFFERF